MSHVTAGANAVPAGLALTGSDVMAAVVGALALFALAFLVVTLIRRRDHRPPDAPRRRADGRPCPASDTGH